MKVSRDWLSDFIDWIETDPSVIADQMTRCMGEVDDVIAQGKYMDRVVVGRVQTLAKHPNADKLSVCTVQVDDGTKTVVCGGTNLREGMLIAFAHVGATVLANGKEEVTLRKVSIRGTESEGMICAAEEVEIQHLFPSKPEEGHRPIADLSALKVKVGTPLRKTLGMMDVTFHVDNHAITNRADLFSHIGIARELVAMGLAKWKKKIAGKGQKFPKISLPFKCINEIPKLVPRYCGCIIEIDQIGETPDWMKRRLEATGWRSISLPVDITNYVAMELGMPLHSFDADDIEGEIRIRTAKSGETITTLDEEERALPEGSIILSDKRGIFDLLGIMGGLRSSTKATTKRIYLHSAIADPKNIRKAIIGTGHRTEAATVYEKGIPLITAETGFFRALELILTLMPGAKIASKMESWGTNGTKKSITLNAETFDTFLGEPIKPAKTKKILSDLGFKVKASSKTLTVTPPLWRNDVTIKQDVVEEVARIYGYANIKPAMPEASITPPARDIRIHTLRSSLKESAYFEMIHLAFAGPDLLRKCNLDPGDAVSIENPIGEEISLMRTSLIPAMLETAAKELPQSPSHLKMYEIGHRFLKGREQQVLACVVAAKRNTTLKDAPVLQLKSDLVAALKASGHSVTIRKAQGDLATFVHPGRAAEIVHEGKVVGAISEIHPDVRANFGLEFRVAAAYVDLDLLLSLTPETLVASPLPAFPHIELDETILLTERAYEERVKKIRTIDPLLRSIEIVNLYESGSQKNMTLRFTYRADDRTLKQDEVEKVHKKVVAQLLNG